MVYVKILCLISPENLGYRIFIKLSIIAHDCFIQKERAELELKWKIDYYLPGHRELSASRQDAGGFDFLPIMY